MPSQSAGRKGIVLTNAQKHNSTSTPCGYRTHASRGGGEHGVGVDHPPLRRVLRSALTSNCCLNNNGAAVMTFTPPCSVSLSIARFSVKIHLIRPRSLISET